MSRFVTPLKVDFLNCNMCFCSRLYGIQSFELSESWKTGLSLTFWLCYMYNCMYYIVMKHWQRTPRTIVTLKLFFFGLSRHFGCWKASIFIEKEHNYRLASAYCVVAHLLKKIAYYGSLSICRDRLNWILNYVLKWFIYLLTVSFSPHCKYIWCNFYSF